MSVRNVKINDKQIFQIQVALDHYTNYKGEVRYPELRDLWRKYVHRGSLYGPSHDNRDHLFDIAFTERWTDWPEGVLA